MNKEAQARIAKLTAERDALDAQLAEAIRDRDARPNLSVALEGTAAGALTRARMRRVLDDWDLRIGARWVAPAGRVVTVVEPKRPTRNGGWVSYCYDGEKHVHTESRRLFLRTFRPEVARG